jgi:hypothetical protein
LTAASVHDSQVAIPLMKMSSAKVDYPMNPNVGWIIARQGIALSDMLYLITDFPEVSIP